MARNKDRKLFRRRDLKNWLPREEEPDYEDREDEPEYDERRPAWVSDLQDADAPWTADEEENSTPRPEEADSPEKESAFSRPAGEDDKESAFSRPAEEDDEEPEEPAYAEDSQDEEGTERWARVRQSTAHKAQADEEWEREAQRVESSQYRRRPLASDRDWDEESISREPAKSKKKNTSKPRKKSARSRADEDERRSFVRTIAIVLVCGGLLLTVALMVLSNFISHPLLALPRKMVSSVITPVQGFFSGITDSVVDYLRTLKIRGNLEYEYEQLRLRVDEDANELAIIEEQRRTITSLYDLLDEQQRNRDMNPVTASVIGHDTANYFSTLTLDVGSKSGVADYMAVVAQGGLVGVTYNVTENKCQVRCIIDSDCTVAGLVQSSRDQGSVKGTLGTNGEPMCRMYYLPDSSLPRPGDVVVTSGVGLEFPKGIPIGYIRESTRGMEDNKSYVVLEPVVDFQHLEYVTVYRYRPFYAEEAQERVSTSSNIKLETLSTPRPVPTWQVEGVSDFLFSPVQSAAPTPAGQTPSPTPTATAVPAVTATPDPNATPGPANLSYQSAEQAGITPTPSPRPTFTPSPSPVPTPDPGAMTVEDDE